MCTKKILGLVIASITILIALSHSFSEIGLKLIIGFNGITGLMCIPKTNKLLRKLGYNIGHIVSYVFLGILYYFYIFPVSIFFKLKGTVQTISTDTYKALPKAGKINFNDMY